MAEHTKGPWRVSESVHGFWIECGTLSDEQGIARTFYNDVGFQVERANAHLIAAAPDLLEANEDALDTCERLIADLREENAALHAQRITVLEMTADKLRAAIAKARNHPKGSH